MAYFVRIDSCDSSGGCLMQGDSRELATSSGAAPFGCENEGHSLYNDQLRAAHASFASPGIIKLLLDELIN